MFNTLNNIYSHSLDKSPKVPEMILKLSDLMSYILYECKDDMVPIENEIAFLKNYIELEKLRYEDRLNVELNIGGEVNDLKIAPLLLISFVENAFKHIGNRFGKRPFVTIDLSFIDGTINLKIVNSVSQEIEKNGKEGGVGIENVKKRLELLYPEKYRLGIEKTENEFIVNLNIG